MCCVELLVGWCGCVGVGGLVSCVGGVGLSCMYGCDEFDYLVERVDMFVYIVR